MRNSLTNPLNGGNPEMAAEATRKVRPVHRIDLSSPPSWSMSRVRVLWTDGTGAEEQQALEDGMVQHVQDAAAEAEHRQTG